MFIPKQCDGYDHETPEYIKTCPHGGRENYNVCDMGDDTSCIHFEGLEDE